MQIKNILFYPLLAAVCAISSCGGVKKDPLQVAEVVQKDQLYPLPAGSVRLNGFFENDIQNSIEHWTKGVMLYAEIVEFFRTGRKQFALGEMWGKAVRSGCMFYRYTQDEEIAEVMRATVKDMLTTQRENGSFSCVPVSQQPDGAGGDMWERKYVLLGLDEYYRQIDADPEVLKAMEAHAQAIIKQIGHAPKVELIELGWSSNHIESATLMEPFMRLYNLTGKTCYLDFAKYIIETGGSKGYNIIAQAYNDVDPHQMGGLYPKAYEMMSLFEGLVDYYRATGDKYVHQAVMNLYDNIRTKEITIIGNGGGDQPYHPQVYGEAWDNTAFEQTNPNITRMMETCVGVTWMKFCSHILRLNASPKAAADIEKYIYNGLIGAMKPSGDGFSYVNLFNGEKVTNLGWGTTFGDLCVTCCNLNGPMGLAYIPYVAVMQSQEGIAVNLYNNLHADARTPKGNSLNLVIEGDFPHSNKITLSFNPEKQERFEVKLRIPEWSKRTIVRVNEKDVEHVNCGEYLCLDRKWNTGDKVEMEFEMKARLINAPRGSNRAGDAFQAVVYGPIVLARDENIDSAYNQPVQVIADEEGTVAVQAVKPTLPGTRMEFIVPTTDGSIRMTDYASVNGWQGNKICTWLPRKQ